jgi:hypothetical protein
VVVSGSCPGTRIIGVGGRSRENEAIRRTDMVKGWDGRRGVGGVLKLFGGFMRSRLLETAYMILAQCSI